MDEKVRKRINLEIRLEGPDKYDSDNLIADEIGWKRPITNGRVVYTGATYTIPASELESGLFLVGNQIPLVKSNDSNECEVYQITSVERPSEDYITNKLISSLLKYTSRTKSDLKQIAVDCFTDSIPTFIAYARSTGEVVNCTPIDIKKFL
jgi:hypothetical protein